MSGIAWASRGTGVGMAWARTLTPAQRCALVEILTGERAAAVCVDAQLEVAVRPSVGLRSSTPLGPLERAGRRRAMLGGWQPGSRPASADAPFDALVASACAGRLPALDLARRGAAAALERAADPVELVRQAVWVNAGVLVEGGRVAFELDAGRVVAAAEPRRLARTRVRTPAPRPRGLLARLGALGALGPLRGGHVGDTRSTPPRRVAGWLWRISAPPARCGGSRFEQVQRALWALPAHRPSDGRVGEWVVELHSVEGGYRINVGRVDAVCGRALSALVRRWSWPVTIDPVRAMRRVRAWIFGVGDAGAPPPFSAAGVAAELSGGPSAPPGDVLWALLCMRLGMGSRWGWCPGLPPPRRRRRRRARAQVAGPIATGAVIALPAAADVGRWHRPPPTWEVVGWSADLGRWVVEVGPDTIAHYSQNVVPWSRWRGAHPGPGQVKPVTLREGLPRIRDMLLVSARTRPSVPVVAASRVEARRPTYDLAARRVPVTPSPPAPFLPRQQLAAELAALPGVVVVDEHGIIRWRVSPGVVVQVGGAAGALDDITPQPRSLVKWPGGKAWARNEIAERLGPIDALGEGCLGGGATLLALLGDGRVVEAFGVDTNPELIHALGAAARWPEAVWYALRERWPTDAATFERRKVQLPADLDPVRRAADFIGHNRTSFNGVVRYGALGASNVSRNPSARLGLDRASFMRIARLLQRARLECDDFCAVTGWAAARAGQGRRVGVFIDAPYEPADGSSDFAAYCGPFGDADQERVVEGGAYAARAGARVVLTNSWSARAVDRARAVALRVAAVFAPRRVNRDGDGRGPVPELLAWSGTSDFGATLVLDERLDSAIDIIDAATRAGVLTMGQRRRCLDRLGGGDAAIRAAWRSVLAKRAASRGTGGRPASITVADVARVRLDGGGRAWTDAEIGAALGASRPAAQRFRARLDEITEAAAAEAGVPITDAARIGWPLLAEGA